MDIPDGPQRGHLFVRDTVAGNSVIVISGDGTRVASTDVNGAVLVADHLATGR